MWSLTVALSFHMHTTWIRDIKLSQVHIPYLCRKRGKIFLQHHKENLHCMTVGRCTRRPNSGRLLGYTNCINFRSIFMLLAYLWKKIHKFHPLHYSRGAKWKPWFLKLKCTFNWRTLQWCKFYQLLLCAKRNNLKYKIKIKKTYKLKGAKCEKV